MDKDSANGIIGIIVLLISIGLFIYAFWILYVGISDSIYRHFTFWAFADIVGSVFIFILSILAFVLGIIILTDNGH